MDKGSDTANNRKQRAIEKNTVSLHMSVGSSPGYTITLKKKKKNQEEDDVLVSYCLRKRVGEQVYLYLCIFIQNIRINNNFFLNGHRWHPLRGKRTQTEVRFLQIHPMQQILYTSSKQN